MIRRFLAPALAAGCLLSIAAPSRAADYVWTNPAGGAWATASNWSPGGVPSAGDNATISASGTYGITLSGTQVANNVTLSAAGATVTGSLAGEFALGGTMTLSAGDWRMSGFVNTPATLRGGSVVRGAGGAGTFTVAQTVRAVGTQFQGSTLRFVPADRPLLRLAGGANFLPGGTVTFPYGSGFPYGEDSGILYESSATLSGTTVNLGPLTNFAAAGGATLTIAADSAVQYTDPNASDSVAVGRMFTEPSDAPTAIVNRGTIRCVGGQMVVGQYFAVPTPRDSRAGLVNSGLIESAGGAGVSLNLSEGFTNEAGGVLRATGGGSLTIFARDWTNAGTLRVEDGSELRLGGTFTRAGLGTVVRSGTNVVGIISGRMDNGGGTFALSAATGSYRLYGDIYDFGEIRGGSITASGGARLEIRPIPGGGDAADFSRLTDVAVGPGVVDLSARNAHLLAAGTTSFAPGDTLDLSGQGASLFFRGSRTLTNLTVNLSGSSAGLGVADDPSGALDNTLTFGAGALVRKTGAGPGAITALNFATPGASFAVVNAGLIRVEQGALSVEGLPRFSNQGTVQVNPGATLSGSFSTSAGGTLLGGGTVTGNPVIASGGRIQADAGGQLGVTGNLEVQAGGGLRVSASRTGAGSATAGLVSATGALDFTGLGGGSRFAIEIDSSGLTLGESYTITVASAQGGLRRNGISLAAGYAFDPSDYALSSPAFPAFSNVLLRTTDGNALTLSFTPVPEPTTLGLVALAACAWLRRRRAKKAQGRPPLGFACSLATRAAG